MAFYGGWYVYGATSSLKAMSKGFGHFFWVNMTAFPQQKLQIGVNGYCLNKYTNAIKSHNAILVNMNQFINYFIQLCMECHL